MSLDMAGTEGYTGRTLVLLQKYPVRVGDFIAVKTRESILEGTLMTRYDYADDQHIVVKLRNGYNIGINIDRIVKISRISEGSKPSFPTPPKRPSTSNLPKVTIISTGGTIASKVDYRTGGVYPALTVEELLSSVPELSSIANIDSEVLFSLYSENMASEQWSPLALKIAEKINDGARGVVVTHGTDTMGYTAAALSFALNDCPIPVVLVGSQRSSDRPSSDAAANLLAATLTAANADFSGVYVSMHHGPSDDTIAIHRGTKARKNHTSRRDALESVNTSYAALVKNGGISNVARDLPPRRNGATVPPKPSFEKRVSLIKFHPDFDPEIIAHLVSRGIRGIVLEGTGLGHVASNCQDLIKKAVESGVIIGMTSQCIWGSVRMTVYDTGRDLLAVGVIPLSDMLPETALVKMMWVLANASSRNEALRLMNENLVGEYASRRLLEENNV
ncbi:MAG: Glu-tRNA(Gln) amidotransferase subunit GatD [Thaumarchaeota archaeon]|nr:Glu-tRNA(Gln) amidotransferase subunit GatD [Nitrososphaerota archaeon]